MNVCVCAEENFLKYYSFIYFVNEMVEYTCVYSLWCTGTLVHWYTGTLVHWYTGTLVHWCTGTLVHWYTGTLVHWYTGALVHWCTGTLVHWYTGALVHWYTGTLVHWCTGTLYTAIQWNQCYNFNMLYEISYVTITITIALLVVCFTLLRKVINLKMAHS